MHGDPQVVDLDHRELRDGPARPAELALQGGGVLADADGGAHVGGEPAQGPPGPGGAAGAEQVLGGGGRPEQVEGGGPQAHRGHQRVPGQPQVPPHTRAVPQAVAEHGRDGDGGRDAPHDERHQDDPHHRPLLQHLQGPHHAPLVRRPAGDHPVPGAPPAAARGQLFVGGDARGGGGAARAVQRHPVRLHLLLRGNQGRGCGDARGAHL
mmetsp:Transcript_33428/g.75552  ORF Transcript_33428/g.75552 Transcript_33428/m.75552 type:complete len:209 (+) Transcript_33428:777-1403(+)